MESVEFLQTMSVVRFWYCYAAVIFDVAEELDSAGRGVAQDNNCWASAMAPYFSDCPENG